MTRPRPADLALVHLLRRSLPSWLRAAGFEAEAAGFDRMPAPTTDRALGLWIDALDPGIAERFALGAALGVLADVPDGRRVTEAARKIPDVTGDRALLKFVADAFGVGTPPWWAAIAAVGTIEKLAERVALVSLAQASRERRPDPVADSIRLLGALARFRTEAAARILEGSPSSRPTAAPRQPVDA